MQCTLVLHTSISIYVALKLFEFESLPKAFLKISKPDLYSIEVL